MQVSDILKICSTHGIPVVPYGGGTSLEGQILSPKRALSIDFKNMRKVLELNDKVRQDSSRIRRKESQYLFATVVDRLMCAEIQKHTHKDRTDFFKLLLRLT